MECSMFLSVPKMIRKSDLGTKQAFWDHGEDGESDPKNAQLHPRYKNRIRRGALWIKGSREIVPMFPI